MVAAARSAAAASRGGQIGLISLTGFHSAMAVTPTHMANAIQTARGEMLTEQGRSKSNPRTTMSATAATAAIPTGRSAATPLNLRRPTNSTVVAITKAAAGRIVAFATTSTA